MTCSHHDTVEVTVVLTGEVLRKVCQDCGEELPTSGDDGPAPAGVDTETCELESSPPPRSWF